MALIILYGGLLSSISVAADSPATGPATEKRFPPLKLPQGFRATLFACDPLIEYPSAIALGPRPGTLFVAADYMTGLGTEIIRRDEIRLIEDTDGDGYADKSTVYAGQFNSIEGLTFHAGVVYAMHAPLLTALRDTDGDGVADERRDIVTGLGLKPEDNPVRLHCANGIVMGHDGWLYLALGDHGCDVARPEGDRLIYNGGGILRCRPDGRDLHVFATGLRNIYDVALDADLNVFVRDNENDGGDYKIRVCHSFFGADHGYPYLYYERPDEALPPLADLGLGSSAGGLCYLEQQFPEEYQGNLFFCEWGRSVVHYRPQRIDGRFAPLKEMELASGAENDPYGFKPTDLVVERDGSLLVADWADGQRPNRGRARIYRIQYGDAPAHSSPASRERKLADSVTLSLADAIAQLDSLSYYQRIEAQDVILNGGQEGIDAVIKAVADRRLETIGRMHAVWIVARAREKQPALATLFEWARADSNVRVRVQAIRAIADLEDPVFVRHRLDAGEGSAGTIRQLTDFFKFTDVRVLFETLVAVGRLRHNASSYWLGSHFSVFSGVPRENTKEEFADPLLAHAAMQTLRKSGNWPAVMRLLDLPDSDPMRSIALRAIADQPMPDVADLLIKRLPVAAEEGQLSTTETARRSQYADALARIHRRPGPWTYWGYRPAPRPANTVAWERTAAIEETLDKLLLDADRSLRLFILRRMQREKIPARLATLEKWLADEREAAAVATILISLQEHPAASVRHSLDWLVADSEQTTTNRLTALGQIAAGLDTENKGHLLDLSATIEDGPVATEVIRHISRHPQLAARPFLLAKLTSPQADVRAAAVDALADLRLTETSESVRKLLDDGEPQVRRAAADAAGRFGDRVAIERLVQLGKDADANVRRASLDALRLLGEPRGVPLAVAALADRQTQAAALVYLRDLGGPQQAQPVIEMAKGDPTTDVVQLAASLLTKWSEPGDLPADRRRELDQAVCELQGRSGLTVRWHVQGPLIEAEAVPRLSRATSAERQTGPLEHATGWRTAFAAGLESRVGLKSEAPATGKGGGSSVPADSAAGGRVWLAATDVIVGESTPVQFLASASGKLQIWLNGRSVFERDQVRAFQADGDRFEGTLATGVNRLVVRVAAPRDTAEFHLRFRRKSSTAEHEALVQAALSRSGDAERGRKLFFDVAKVQCSKCHRIGDQGERIGPELTGIGNRFSRIHIIESILEPSRTVTPGYQTIVIALRDGRVLTGVKIAEADRTLTLGDNQGQKHELAKSDIEEQTSQTQSTMPDGLVKQITPDQFVDLIAFLASRKENPK